MANIELDGVNKKIKVDSGDLTLDVPGDIVLDADGGDVVVADGGTNILKVSNSSSDVVLQPQVDAKDIIFKQYDGTTVATVEDNGTFNIPTDKLAINGTAVTSTAAELNILDGVTATATELNLIDGVTATTAELNILDGVTATASELNLLDGGTSVGSSITLADGDGVVVNDGGTMKTIPASDISTYAGGNLVKLASASDYDGAASELNFTNIFSSTYDNYLVVGFIAPSSDGEIRMRWTTGGTDTDYTTGDYNWIATTKNVNSSHTLADQDGGYHAESYIPICFADINADNDSDAGSFTMTISDPNTNILSRAYVNGTAIYRNGGTEKLYTERFGGANESNVNATGFMLYNSGGNIRDHSVCVYGFKK